MIPTLALGRRWRNMKHKARSLTLDREIVPVLVAEQIGPKRSKTPEGFLLCRDVPAARVGLMIYGPGEVPLKAGQDGLIRVHRDADTLFAPTALASYQGKPVVDDHPDDEVKPDNWKQLSIGVTLNPRRGEGEDDDVMLVDLLITDRAAIRDVEAGKREVSAGYEADYEQIADGEGRQTNIIGNHIALVDKGRCGPRCAIGDHQPKELQSMATKTTTLTRRATFADKLRNIFKDAGEEAAAALNDPALAGGDEDGDTHIHIHAGGAAAEPAAAEADPAADPAMQGAPTQDDPNEARFKSLEDGHAELKQMLSALMEKLNGGETTDEADDVQPEDAPPEDVAAAMSGKTGDSVALQTAFQAVLADAEVLVPGFRLPTFDSKAKRKATVDAMCKVRRGVLSQLSMTNDGAALLNTFTAGKTFDTAGASCIEVASLFRSAAGAKKLLNNNANTRDANRLPQPTARSGAAMPKTLAELNKLHAAHYAAKAH